VSTRNENTEELILQERELRSGKRGRDGCRRAFFEAIRASPFALCLDRRPKIVWNNDLRRLTSDSPVHQSPEPPGKRIRNRAVAVGRAMADHPAVWHDLQNRIWIVVHQSHTYLRNPYSTKPLAKPLATANPWKSLIL
jgi:hypothetical protein